MKLAREGSPVTISGTIGGPSDFCIASSRTAFSIMSDRLYNNKIGACIRELSCNAYDAHIEAGKKNEPFEIHIPTSFEPWFTVKDFGVGMEHGEYPCPENNNKGAGILGMYCTYFSSTKSDSDDYIGAMGLGSKSPFCYTEGFTVISRYQGDASHCPSCGVLVRSTTNGVDSNQKPVVVWEHPDTECDQKIPIHMYRRDTFICGKKPGFYDRPCVTRVYSAYINERGTPSIVLNSEEETPRVDENGVKFSKGLEVSFPVKEADCWEFENNAKVMLEFFEPTPNIKVEIPVTKYTIRTPRWGMRENASTHQGGGMRAIQGMVVYSIGKIDISKMGPELQRLTEMPLDLFFPIGELSFAANREDLSLDPHTVDNIKKALEEVFVGLVDEVKKKIESCQRAWEAHLLLWSLTNAPGTGKIINEAWKKGSFDGAYPNFILGKQPFVNELDYLHTQIYKFKYNARSEKYSSKTSVFTRGTSEHRALTTTELQNGTKKREDFEHQFDVKPEVAFVINDIKFGGEKYIHYFLQEASDNLSEDSSTGLQKQQVKVVYLFSRMTTQDTPDKVMREAASMVEKLGNPPIMLMSEMKKKYSPLCDIAPVKKVGPRTPHSDVLEFNTEYKGRKLKKDYYFSSQERYGARSWYNCWKPSSGQPVGPKYYVVQVDKKATECGFNKADDFFKFVNEVQKSGAFGLDFTTPVYGLKPKSELRSDPEWIELTSHVFSTILSVMTPDKEAEMTLLFNPFTVSEWNEEIEKLGKDSSFPSTSLIKKFSTTLAEAKKNSKKLPNQSLLEVWKEAKNRSTSKKDFELNHLIDFKGMWSEIEEAFPMLQMSSSRWHEKGDYKIFKDYIKDTEELRAIKEAVAAEKSKMVTEVAVAAMMN